MLLALILTSGSAFSQPVGAEYEFKLINPQRALFSVLADFDFPRSHDSLIFKIPATDNHYTEGYGQHIKKLDLIRLSDSANLKLTRMDDNRWLARDLSKGSYRIKYLLPIQHIMMLSEYGVDETPFFFDNNGILIGTGMLVYPELAPVNRPDSIVLRFAMPPKMLAIIPEQRLDSNSYLIRSFEDVQNDYWAVGMYDTLTLGSEANPLLVAVQDNAFGFTRDHLVYDLRCVWNEIFSLFGAMPPANPHLYITRFPLSHENQEILNGGASSPGSINILLDDKLKARGLDENFGLVAYNLFVQWIPISFYPEDRLGMNWLIQGAANYYQNLLLLRCDIISEETFLNRVVQTYEHYLTEYERRGLSPRAAREIPAATGYVGAAEFLTAMALDLKLRSLAYGQFSLDDYISAITARFKDGQSTFESYHLYELCDTLSGYYPKYFIDSCLNLNTAIDLPGLLDNFGVRLKRVKGGKPDFGVQFKSFDDLTVADVRRGGPAYDAGLDDGDLIQKINKREFKNAIDLVRYIETLKPNRTISVEYLRAGQKRKAKVRLGGLDKYEINIDKSASRVQKERWQDYSGQNASE